MKYRVEFEVELTESERKAVRLMGCVTRRDVKDWLTNRAAESLNEDLRLRLGFDSRVERVLR